MTNLSTSNFTYDKPSKTFVSEASSLIGDKINFQDGINLTSHITGVQKLFNYVETIYDKENDVISWNFASNDGFAIEIFND